ncbi:MAG: phosphoribosylamine--glycine ligase [Fidelibacterota bacterium]
MRIGIIGSGAREHAIARALSGSGRKPDIFIFGTTMNPGAAAMATDYVVGNITQPEAVVTFGREKDIDWVFIGPEAPLAAGVADALWAAGIPCIGPTKNLARIESSKAFTRNLLDRYAISGNPRYKKFSSLTGVSEFLSELGENYVVKYDGLRGGKGVKVAGDHLHSHAEALEYAGELVVAGGSFVIEEKMIGEEFSLMSFCDGTHLAHMIPVQDHKRAYENDVGPNTGGMGSYSDVQGTLPFLNTEDITAARAINEATIQALKQECGSEYKGILYGGFMATADGVKLVEYNARFGDPEALNVLSLLETDLVSIGEHIIAGTLDRLTVSFAPQATVCKYLVPEGYPDHAVKGQPIDLSGVSREDIIYYASVDVVDDRLVEAGSRTVAVVGQADSLSEAEEIAEKEIQSIKGPLFHRKDIGTTALIQKRVEHMNQLRG